MVLGLLFSSDVYAASQFDKDLKKVSKNSSFIDRKAEMEAIQQQMAEAKKNERTSALKEVKRLCKEFGFTAGMLKGSIAEGRMKK